MVSARTKFTVLLLVIFLGASAAYAGPGDLSSNPRTFAHEIGNYTLSLAPQVYTMGIDRTAEQDMAIRLELNGGAVFAATPAIADFVIGGAGAATITYPGVGGIGQNFVEFEIDITTAFVAGTTTITMNNLQITGLGSAPGTAIAMRVSLRDLFFQTGVDLNGIKSRTVALLQPVTSLTANTDTGTTIDAITDPATTGFVPQNDDLRLLARAPVTVITTLEGVSNAAGTADYVLGADGLVTFTVTGDFTGVATWGFFYDLNNDGISDVGERFTITGTTATLTVPGNLLGAQHSMSFVPTGTTPLSVRTFTITAKLDMTPFSPIGGGNDRDPIAGANSNWWVWNINGTFLRAPYITFSPGNEVKFRFINNTANPVVVEGVGGPDTSPGIVIDQGTFIANPAHLNANGKFTFTIPAYGSVHVELSATPSPGTGAIGPLVSELTSGTQPIRGRANFLALTGTNNVTGQVLVASPTGVITVYYMVQNPEPGISFMPD